MIESEWLAMALLDEWMSAFNARELGRWAATFNFPSVRLASGRVVTLDGPESLRADTFERLVAAGWDHSAWDRRDVIHASADKVHFDTRFTRYGGEGTAIGSYNSIYVVTLQRGHWGVQARSSFAP